MQTGTAPKTWIKMGFFFLGFTLMFNIIVWVIRHFIVPRYIDPIVDWADPRGMDVVLGLMLTPFWFLFGLLNGMLNVNLSIRLNNSKSKAFLPYLAIAGYVIFMGGIGSLVYRVLHSG